MYKKHNFKEIHKKKYFSFFGPNFRKRWQHGPDAMSDPGKFRGIETQDSAISVKISYAACSAKSMSIAPNHTEVFRIKKSLRRSSYFLFIFQQQRQYIFFSNLSNSYSFFIPFSLHSDQHSEILYEIPCE